MSSDSKQKIGYTKSMIEWRRNKVLHRMTMGWSQAEIAQELQLHPSTISLDVQFLKENAKKELETHIQERLPFEYARAMEGINNVLKKTSEILEAATDTRAKMEALKLQMELYKSIMSLATDGGIVERAMKLVRGIESREAVKAVESIQNTASEEGEANIASNVKQDDIEPEEDLNEEE